MTEHQTEQPDKTTAVATRHRERKQPLHTTQLHT